MDGLVLPDISNVSKVITCTIEGFLEPEDLLALVRKDETTGEAIAPQEAENPLDLKRIKEKHHSVARLIAQGMTQSMVATITGYTESYLSVLLNSPAMQELVLFYRASHGAAHAVITERLKDVGMQAMERIESKLPDMNAQELVSVAKLGLDRAGHGPTSKQHVVREDHLVDHARIQELNAKARAESEGYIVPIAAVRAAALPAPAAEPTPTQEADSNEAD